MGNSVSGRGKVVDWSAALWAGIVSGIVFYILNIFLIPFVYGGNSATIIRYLASPILGESILPPPASLNIQSLLISIICTIVLSIVFTFVVSYVLHQGGIILGIVGGALFGLALYFINFNTLTLLVPWLYALSSPLMMLNHVIFGILAGGLYETLEVEEYELWENQ